MADKVNEKHDNWRPTMRSKRFSLNTTMANASQVSSLYEDNSDSAQLGIRPMSAFTDEDAESLIGPSMSRVATRLKSARTPALEKRNAMEEALAYFDGIPDTPPADIEEYKDGAGCIANRSATSPSVTASASSSQTKHGRVFSLGRLPPSQPEGNEELPTPWHSEPKKLVVPSDRSQSALYGVFAGGTERKRAMSGGTEALKKFLPKGMPWMPSMAQVGNYFSTGSSGILHKAKPGSPSSPPKSPNRLGNSGGSSTTNSSQSNLDVVDRPNARGNRLKNPLRRVSSDQSMLYHTLSRASSMGDDTQFEGQRYQINSRAKAIRDSLQDRSSFRIPNMPSIPSLPNFGFSMNFLGGDITPSTRAKSRTVASPNDSSDDVLYKRPASLSNPVGGRERTKTSSPPKLSPTTPRLAEGHTSIFDHALESLVGDIVIMGGYRGSILRSTKTHRQVWAPMKIGLNIRKVNLEVGLEPEDEERMEETIYPSGMLQGIGPVDISRRLFKRLNSSENARQGLLRVWNYGYDWRLSPALLAKKLTRFLENLPSNKLDQASGTRQGALVISHSLGGLITRHVVNHRPELFAGVVYAGVPQSCINILGPLRNGDAVLLSSKILTAQVNFTLRTSFVLLPEDGKCFIDINTKERFPMDFFNIDDWIKYRLSPCTDPPLPPYAQQGGIGNLININLSGSMLSIPKHGKKSGSTSGSITPPAPVPEVSEGPVASQQGDQHLSKTTRAAKAMRDYDGGKDRTIAPQLGGNKCNSHPTKNDHTTSSVSTTVTIPRDKAIAYLRRTLAETKKFKQELYFKPELSQANKYPPMAIMYGKSIPTCCGAKVDTIDSIPCADVYDNLAFAAGDGVCLAKEAMLPEGYQVVRGGRIRSDRGHVTLLGDLNAVGRAIEAVSKGRGKGIGTGVSIGA
ncbi:hypothetical protein BJ878DRAFT_493261 [Calycina marina]|uniref:Uncharacterized protein n=1 Tax=Calycina marina TaxID=1763456 RepID=A0A9P7Z8H3_9HELO|nr:hypothetical protein BJ878DRAFT_493261 [Calycina marina]